jgi:nitrile hydratase subunit beta
VNGAHDMGGMHGFGPVLAEPDEPVFHADWERRVFALTLAMGGTAEWNRDAARFARENRPPHEYLDKTYYEVWLAGLEQLLTERGLASDAELTAGRELQPRKPVRRTLSPADVTGTLGRGSPTNRHGPGPAAFQVGDRVRAKNMNPLTHTRLPRYVRGHVGTVTAIRGCHVFPDSNADGRGEDPQYLYSVRFDARELWGPDADPALTVSIDAFEPYLEPTS